jgi:hypothetical protein
MFQTAKSLMELVCATGPWQFFLSFFLSKNCLWAIWGIHFTG